MMGQQWKRTVRWGVVLASVAGIVACTSGNERGRVSDSVGTATAGDSGPIPALSWRFESPPSWDERVRMVDDPEGEARLKEQGIHDARLFEYLPRDTSIVPQTLLGVYVYDSTAWAALEAEEGPPQGDLIARGPGVAYVVGFPQSNPFAGGSVDSVEFDKRSVTMEYVKRAFRVVR